MVVPVPRVITLTGLGAQLLPPVAGPVSSDFGPRAQPTAGASTNHKGIDYAVPVGTPVAAAAGGRVVFAGVQSGYGNVVQVDNGGGVVTTYGHLSAIRVHQGDEVAAGQLLGESGATGTVTGPNLHFGVSVNGVWQDPESFLVQASIQNVYRPSEDFFAELATELGTDKLTLGLTGALVGLTALVVLV